jgi:hypothetical protein
LERSKSAGSGRCSPVGRGDCGCRLRRPETARDRPMASATYEHLMASLRRVKAAAMTPVPARTKAR